MINYCIEKIISGGQTGADRAGLDWAIENGIPHSGWCPRNRLSEDGIIPSRYNMRETESRNPAERTEKNVIESDGTVIFTISTTLSGGSGLTWRFCSKHQKPRLHLNFYTPNPDLELIKFLRNYNINVLNIAGTRSSKERGIYTFVTNVLNLANRPLIKGQWLHVEYE